MKSIQPDFEEGKSDERLNNYVKKFRRQAQQALASQVNKPPLSVSVSVTVEISGINFTVKYFQHCRSSSPEPSEENDLNSQKTGLVLLL